MIDLHHYSNTPTEDNENPKYSFMLGELAQNYAKLLALRPIYPSRKNQGGFDKKALVTKHTISS
jgi:hypothetical protein